MNIDIKEYLLNYIGHIDWYGETNYDNVSCDNMNKADEVLSFLEDLRGEIMWELEKHQYYRKGNYSAEMLHKKAGNIIYNHRGIDNEINENEFYEYWEE